MEYLELGPSGQKVSRIGFGTWRYTGGEKPLRRAVELGCNLIDTAEQYRTEAVVGEAIRPVRDHVMLSTKVWPSHFRRDDLLAAAGRSLRRLRTDCIDLYQLHWPNPTVPIEETMEAMAALVEQGKVRHVGLSNFSPRQIAAARAAAPQLKIVSNQMAYSLLLRNAERRLLPDCETNRITPIAYRPLEGGIHNLHAVDRQGVIKRLAADTGKSEAQIAINWCLARPEMVVLVKTDRLDRVDEACGATGWRLSPTQYNDLTKAVNLSWKSRIMRFIRKQRRSALEAVGWHKPLYRVQLRDDPNA